MAYTRSKLFKLPLMASTEQVKITGLRAGRLISLGSIMPSPGFLTEVLHLFLALDLTQGDTDPDEDEFIRVEKHSMDSLHRMILDNEITDAKTIAIYYKAADYMTGGK